MIKICFFIILSISILNANENTNEQYDEIFVQLANEGIAVGEDVQMEDLFKIIQSEEFKNKNGTLNQKKLNNKIKELISYNKEQYDKINDKLDKNPNNKFNKEIKNYFTNNNSLIKKTQDDLKKSDNDGWFSSFVNYVLELMKM